MPDGAGFPACPAFSVIARQALREPIREPAPDVVRHRTDARPARLRLTHFLGRGAQTALLLDLAADGVGGERFLEHRGQPRGRRQLGVQVPPVTDRASSSTRRTSVSIRFGSRPDPDRCRRMPTATARGPGRIRPGSARRARRPVPDRRRARRAAAAIGCGERTFATRSAGGLTFPARRIGRRGQRFEIRAEGFARRHLLGARRLVTAAHPVEKPIARAVEPLPDRFRTALLHRADRLPFQSAAAEARRRPRPHSTESASASTLAQSASFFARFSAHSFLRSARSA